MANCPNLKRCRFFNGLLRNLPAHANPLKRQFCRGDFFLCARYRIAVTLGKAYVPGDLFPADVGRAETILARERRSRATAPPDPSDDPPEKPAR